MGRRSRRRGERPSSAARDEVARAGLEPLAAGERPRALVVAVVVALGIAVANVGFLAAGWEVSGEQPAPVGVLGFSALMLVCAYFMWEKRYWAVLGFQALLTVSCIFAGLSLLVASNVQAALLSLSIMVLGGTLFWFLIRVMARLQMPERPDSVRRHG